MIIDKSQRIFTIPNILSIFRIGILPVFTYIYLTADTDKEYFLAVFLFFLSALSDCFDGMIARKFNQITELGKLLDPAADKLTQIVLLFCLAQRFKFVWSLAFICLAKDIFMTFMGALILKIKKRKLNGAKWYGKVSTAYAYAVILILLLFPRLEPALSDILTISCEILMILSIVLYARVFYDMWKGEA